MNPEVKKGGYARCMIIYALSLPLKDSYLFEGDHQIIFWLIDFILGFYSLVNGYLFRLGNKYPCYLGGFFCEGNTAKG